MIRDDDFISKRLGGDDSVWNSLEYDRDGIIEASAGTGKTYALQSIVLKLVSDREHPVDIRNILLVTFTEKAAGELKDRIRDILSKAGCLSASFDEATICTIHSFCRELISEYAFENRVPMQMVIGGSNADLIHRAVRAALLGDEFKNLYGEPYRAYMMAAGIGSTEDLAAKVEKVLDDCAKNDNPPKEPQRLDDALKGVIAEVASKLNLDFSGLRIHGSDKTKFEDACKKIAEVREDLSSDNSGTMVAALMKCAGVSDKLNPRVTGSGSGKRLFDIRPELREFVEAVGKVKDVVSAQMAADLAFFAWPQFCRLKDESSILTFDDLVTQTYRVVSQEADREAEGKRSAFMDAIRRRYRIALVDEFQDTDDRQWAIFGKLFSSRVNRIEGDGVPEPRQGMLLVVGDPKQAIYAFRGANVATYLAAKKKISTGEGTQSSQTLKATFRSSRDLVAAFNSMFGEGSGWFKDMGEKDERIEYFPVEYPEGNKRFYGLDDKTGRSAVTFLESLPQQLHDEVKGQSGYGNRSICLPVFMRNAALEMKRLAALPVAYWTKDPDTGKPEKHSIGYGDMCVLVRGGREANVVKGILAEHGIPYSHYKERGIYASPEAEALIALFDFLSMPGRSGNLAALLLTSLFNVHPSELEKRLSSDDKALSALCGKWIDLSGKRDWNALFESVMNDTALAHPKADDYGFDRRWTAYRQMLDRLLLERGRSATVPEEFAGLLRSWRKDDRRAGEDGSLRQKEKESDSVQIMTMHASKGLEFKAVFIASGFSEVKEDELQDEKRLFYVALTRAEHKLYLPWTKWDAHTRVNKRNGVEQRSVERGIGSRGAPLLGDGFLSRAIRAFSENARAETLSLSDADVPNKAADEAAGPSKSHEPPTVYEIGDLWHLRLNWDSFSSLARHGDSGHRSADRVVPSEAGEQDEKSTGMGAVRKVRAPLLPRNNISGNVFHEIMETLCGTDEATGAPGFALGREPLENAISDDGPLIGLVRRIMRRNALGNREDGDDSTERTLARMVWNALNARITIGARTIYLKDIAFADRLAEVEFVMDEKSIMGELTPRCGGAVRDGAFNGKIDLLVRPDGMAGEVYVLDWKTNSLADYGKSGVEDAMDAAGYPLQFKLYSLAVSRWLGLQSLGGVAYLFVRGCEAGKDSGVYSRAMDENMFTDCFESVLSAVSAGK